MRLLGQFGLWLGLVGAAVAVILYLVGRSKQKKLAAQASSAGNYATLASMMGMTIAVMVLTVGFVVRDFSMLYIAENHSKDISSLAFFYDLSAIWAGQAGSLLFWAWLMTLFAGYLAFRNVRRDDKTGLHAMALMVMNFLILCFSSFMVTTKGHMPFIATPAHMYIDGVLVGQAVTFGMNPLLQHWAMILHPPTLFLGYAGLAVPFAYAMGAVISGDLSSNWVKACDRITVFSWYWLGIGIWVGAIWAYVVLGWGGFWAWDPVENASMLPWFAGLALIHSMTVYRRKGNMRVWTLMLAAFTYVMVVMGTFIVRSGIITASVHVFPGDPIARNTFAAIMIGSLVAMLAGVIYRWNSLRNNSDFDSLTGKDAMYYINNVVMTLMTLILLFMTTSQATTGRIFAISQYEVIARFLGIIYIALIAICPLLNWGKTDGKTFLQRTWVPAAVSLLPFAFLVWKWWVDLRPVYHIMAASPDFVKSESFTMYGEPLYAAITLVAFYLSCFLIVTNVFLFIRGTKARMAGTGENALKAFGNILSKARMQSGGYISHLAIGLTVIGLVGSIMYVESARFDVPLREGARVEISNYAFTLEDFTREIVYETENEEIKETVRFAVERDGQSIGYIEPTRYHDPVRSTPDRQSNRVNATVKSELLRDIFVTFDQDPNFGVNEPEGSIPFAITINPLIWIMWIGSGLLLVGNALAAWPKPQPQPALPAKKAGAKKGGSKQGGLVKTGKKAKAKS
ncbi:MAG: cytochrome c biogenesis protein CcsA [Coriobacteriia bacterium]|nr:cytochrome c biogenesis protein CcsA [Coriobacteriia bacterium]